MTMQREFELELTNGKVVTWHGTDGENAARRYVDCKRDTGVIAWREIRHGLFVVHPSQIVG